MNNHYNNIIIGAGRLTLVLTAPLENTSLRLRKGCDDYFLTKSSSSSSSFGSVRIVFNRPLPNTIVGVLR